MILGIIITAAVAIVVLAIFYLRKTRREPMPCPFSLRIALQNPYMRAVAGEKILIDRLAIKPGMHVLDVGCGYGRLTIPIANRVLPNGSVVALDGQDNMLSLLRSRAEGRQIDNIETVLLHVGRGEMVWKSRFDRAILVTVLGEIPDKKAALHEISLALKPGGILSITEVIPDPHYQSAGAVRSCAEAAGLRMVNKYGGFFAFTLNFMNPPTRRDR